eukprot:TRINITY_DN105579_c0_g1_i1.p1 TRINITY_DN105579_c0_g1~~TRINITY_DN105579_c0_g1_i1.p1  ORF type:complete len:812 (-),score=181.86 TRINITY_DN105579_c0_g1_i1:125-2527(-)
MAPKKKRGRSPTVEGLQKCPVRGCSELLRADEMRGHLLECHPGSKAAKALKSETAEAKALKSEAAEAKALESEVAEPSQSAQDSPVQEPFSAPWRVEVFDFGDTELSGSFVREALAVEGRPAYKADSGRRIVWKGSAGARREKKQWQLLGSDGSLEAVLDQDLATPVQDTSSAEHAWKTSRGRVLVGVHCKVSPPQRLQLQPGANAIAAEGIYQLTRARCEGRPVYRRQPADEEEGDHEDEDSSSKLAELFHVASSGRGKNMQNARWEVRDTNQKGPLLESFDGDAALPQELPGNFFQVMDTRSRDPIRRTHDPLRRRVADVVEDFEPGQEDQPTRIDNIQNARAVTSVIRWWHVARFNWAVCIRGPTGCSQLRDDLGNVELPNELLTDTHCDFCGRQRRLYCLRAYRKLSACPDSCQRCAEMNISNALSEKSDRYMMHEIFWGCMKCVQYLLGEKAARLKPKKAEEGSKSKSKKGEQKEITARTVDEEDVRALLSTRPASSSGWPEPKRAKVVAPRKQNSSEEKSEEKSEEEEEDEEEENDEEEDADAPNCDCGFPAVSRQVMSAGANQGKYFYRCSVWPEAEHCDFFVWKGTAGAPKCRCGQRALERKVKKDGPNKDKLFYVCPRPREKQCRFFEWADGPGSPQPRKRTLSEWPSSPQAPARIPAPAASTPPRERAPAASEEQQRLCHCGQPARRLQVKKEGSNHGRFFFKCASNSNACRNFFEWADEPPRQQAAAAPASRASRSSSSGGAARPPSGAGAPPARPASGGAVGSGRCFHCGAEGHWARDCPAKRSGQRG